MGAAATFRLTIAPYASRLGRSRTACHFEKAGEGSVHEENSLAVHEEVREIEQHLT